MQLVAVELRGNKSDKDTKALYHYTNEKLLYLRGEDMKIIGSMNYVKFDLKMDMVLFHFS